ncbi:crotonase/enoyl-CoA hydratase family protein [Sphingomonas tabacisoli]|uniref:Crotonase/enoyl-CoA hydratase family protein n=1 Tax=Sphingomonas tabacisoli TaxID=2249466 RepID=A0ABW4I750_9SPHN
MADSSEQPVLVELHDHVLVITMNRPEARNACNLAMWVGVGEALEEADRNTHVRAVIITAAGDKSFCAGADLKAIVRGEPAVPSDPKHLGWGFAGVVNHPISKPVIAAVNGAAMGGGCEIALACDLVVAADHALFGLPEVKVGLIATAGGVFRLPRQVPLKQAMEMILTGRPISAARAAELGLINRVVTAADVMPTAMALAQEIAANAPLAVQASKQIALGTANGAYLRETDDWATNQRFIAMLMKSEDAHEGPRAFAEKRAPKWKAR